MSPSSPHAPHSADLRSSTDSLLGRLPSSLFNLILCFLPLDDKLDHCSHLSPRLPPLSPAALRNDELQLTAASAIHFLRSPRLVYLFSQLSALSCAFDEWVIAPTYTADGAVVPYGVSEMKLPAVLVDCLTSHFSSLTRLSIHCPAHHICTQQALLPRLVGSESTIRSLAFTSTMLDTSSSWLHSAISPLSALRSLSLAVTLQPDCLNLLLQQPLHVLDLSGSRLTRDAPPPLPETGWVLASTCRVLRLPATRFLVSDYYLDSIIERWPAEVAVAGRQLDTLAIAHVMSDRAVEAALASPAPHNLHIAIEGHKADLDYFLPTATSLPHLNPPNLHLRVIGRHWRNVEKLQSFLDFLTRHPTHVRTVDVVLRRQPPYQTWLAQKLLAALSHCSRLQSVVIQCGDDVHHRAPVVNPQWVNQRAAWAPQISLPCLRRLSVTNVAEADLCRIVAASPSLEYCSVDLPTVSLDLLPQFASTCPKLHSLHVRCQRRTPHSQQDDEKQQQQWLSAGSMVVMSRQADGSTELPPAARWDDESSEEEDDQSMSGPPHSNIGNVQPPSSMHFGSTSASSSSNHSVHPSVPTFHSHSFLSHFSHLTSVTITVLDLDFFATCILHTLGLLAMHTPMLETFLVALEPFPPGSGVHSHAPLDVAAVREVASRYKLPTGAFGQLRRVQQVELTRLPRSVRHVKPLMSREALEWLQKEWFARAPFEVESALVRLMKGFELTEAL